jgi:hypothetical protein
MCSRQNRIIHVILVVVLMLLSGRAHIKRLHMLLIYQILLLLLLKLVNLLGLIIIIEGVLLQTNHRETFLYRINLVPNLWCRQI